MSLQETVAFFEHYRDTFNRLDGDGIADVWHTPSAITDTRGEAAHVTWWAEDAPMRQNMRALCDVYRGAGDAQWRFELRDHVAMGANHAFAHVRWTLARANGSAVQAFNTGYQLARFEAGPRVLMCTAYQEDISEFKRHAAQ
jgi:hypothetical protein